MGIASIVQRGLLRKPEPAFGANWPFLGTTIETLYVYGDAGAAWSPFWCPSVGLSGT